MNDENKTGWLNCRIATNGKYNPIMYLKIDSVKIQFKSYLETI
jgi:hypothetical protein